MPLSGLTEVFRHLFEQSPDGIMVLDPATTGILECNPAMRSMLGYSEGARGPSRIADFEANETPEEIAAHVAKVDRLGRDEFETKWRRLDGSLILVDVRAGRIEVQGRVLCYAIAHDITERRAAEAALQREQRLFLGGPVIAFRWRAAPGWPVEYVSSNISQFGYSVEDFISGRVPYASIVHPDDLQRVSLEVRRHTAEGHPTFSQTYRIRRADGEYVHLQDQTVVVRDASGLASHYEGYVFDDTQRRRAERRLALLVRKSPIGIIVWNNDYTVREWNPAAAAIFGYREDEATGLHASVIVPPSQWEAVRAVFQELFRGTGGERSRNENLTKDGRTVLCDWYNTTLADDDGHAIGVASMVEDVTAEVRAQNELVHREQELRLITDAVPAMIAHLGRDGRFRFANRAYRDWLKLDLSQMLGRTRNEIFGSEIEARVTKHVETVLSGRETRFEASAVQGPGGIRDFDATYIPHVHNGQVEGYYVLAVDVTARRQVERELAQYRDHLEALVKQRTDELQAQGERLRQASQLASLGTLAAGLGHDMNNMLLPMRCALDSLQGAPDIAGQKPHVAALRRSLEFLSRLSMNLLTLASAPDDAGRATARTSLAKWWAREGAMLAAAATDVSLKLDLPAGIPDLAIASEQLTRAVLNLIVNASEATGPGGEVGIWARVDDASEGSMIVVAVSDNGPGMPESVQQHAFEPFFTTKKRGFSTGLGLSLVHAAVNAAGGSVRIRSSPGQGTTVMLHIPKAVYALKSGPQVANGRRQSGCVSFTDDRVAGYIMALFEARRIPAVRRMAVEGPGDATIWVTEPCEQALSQCKRNDGSRKTIVVGDAGPEWAKTGAILIREATDVAAIAAALR